MSLRRAHVQVVVNNTTQVEHRKDFSKGVRNMTLARWKISIDWTQKKRYIRGKCCGTRSVLKGKATCQRDDLHHRREASLSTLWLPKKG